MNEPAPAYGPRDGERQPGAPGPEAPEAATLRRLHPAAVTLWRLGTLARGGLFVVLLLAAELLLPLRLPAGILAFLLAIAVVATAVIVPPIRYRNWGFILRDRELYMRYGVLFRTTSIVPHARIQHVDTRHGPLDRWLGLAELVVFTAGTRGAILSIPALAHDDAESLRDRLAELSGGGDAV